MSLSSEEPFMQRAEAHCMSCGHQNNQRVTQQHRESLKIGRMAELWLALGKNSFWKCGAGRACGGEGNGKFSLSSSCCDDKL